MEMIFVRNLNVKAINLEHCDSVIPIKFMFVKYISEHVQIFLLHASIPKTLKPFYREVIFCYELWINSHKIKNGIRTNIIDHYIFRSKLKKKKQKIVS